VHNFCFSAFGRNSDVVDVYIKSDQRMILLKLAEDVKIGNLDEGVRHAATCDDASPRMQRSRNAPLSLDEAWRLVAI
jgi:hypothetical protein